MSSGDESFLDSHRREIVVVFCDLRRFTAFAETSEPEEVMGVLSQYHAALGDLIFALRGHPGALRRRRADGLLQRPAALRGRPGAGDPDGRGHARRACRSWPSGWVRRGHDLSFAAGIAQGYATLGRIGFEGRFDYAAIGSVTNLAARLCAEAAPWQILVTQRVYAEAEDVAVGEPVGELTLKGFSRPVPAFNIRGLDAARTPS